MPSGPGKLECFIDLMVLLVLFVVNATMIMFSMTSKNLSHFNFVHATNFET